ncbi:DUF1345 domain-containing protein [Hyphomicrobium sp.]|uniref:DUF1345 domain-containing protein n=1 Tax=Hyphomicrobium sp. TaxID=82 RepID=UPI000FC2569B|nr:DUF1345 domain-containing protein [Hyphomicrobium sp.]RUP00024.1 MAG: DUF1345 domain-containing protein [Hyphomicrobium sp.]
MADTVKIGTVSARRRSRWYNPRSIGRSLVLHPRVIIGAIVGIAALFLLPSSVHGAVREALAWCAGGAVYLAMTIRTMIGCRSDKIRTRAARQDDSGVVILVVVLTAMFSSFAAIFGLLGAAKAASNEGKLLFVGLAALTIVISWLVTQVAFTLHYAHEYYAPEPSPDDKKSAPPPALAFPNDLTPDYWDFFYFATSFGAASQTSDVMINSKELRRLTTLHAIVSFFFNTMVLALTINLAASLAS